jgi:N-carbamoyl-L-amino-acid hydrolase
MDRRGFLAAAASLTGAGTGMGGRGGRAGAPWRHGTSAPGQVPLRVNGERLNARLAELTRFGRTPDGTNRLAYSDADRAARDWVAGLMREAGLAVRVDAGANLIGRRPGRDARRAPILIGSHIDSVPDGGNYDGDVGSLGALEVAQTLAERGVSTRHPLEVVVFSNEEGGLIGSQAMIGDLTDEALAVVSRSGKTIREGIRFLGGNPDRLGEARRGRGEVAAYLELHIEQGGTLDDAGVHIGVVEGIVGIRWYEVTIEGFANHAGTTPMDRRRDALLAAAQLVLAVNRIVTAEPGRQVGTVGRIQAYPGAPNVVPGRVVLTVEVRDLSAETIERLARAVMDEAERIARATGTTVSFRPINENVPAPTDPRVRRLIAQAAERLGFSHRSLPSGAGHDAQDLARIAPVGMIFVPSVGGISHSPREFTRPEDVTRGADVLLHTVLAIDAGGLDG